MNLFKGNFWSSPATAGYDKRSEILYTLKRGKIVVKVFSSDTEVLSGVLLSGALRERSVKNTWTIIIPTLSEGIIFGI